MRKGGFGLRRWYVSCPGRSIRIDGRKYPWPRSIRRFVRSGMVCAWV